MCFKIIYLKYMLKHDLVLNDLQWLMCHKIQTNKQTNKQIELWEKLNIQSNNTENYNSSFTLSKEQRPIKELLM